MFCPEGELICDSGSCSAGGICGLDLVPISVQVDNYLQQQTNKTDPQLVIGVPYVRLMGVSHTSVAQDQPYSKCAGKMMDLSESSVEEMEHARS